MPQFNKATIDICVLLLASIKIRQKAVHSYVLHSTSHVGRDSHVEFLWIWQVQIGHDIDKIGLGFSTTQPRIGVSFDSNRSVGSALVVMGGVDNSVIRQRKELLVDRLEQGFWATTLKIGPSTPLDQEGIPR